MRNMYIIFLLFIFSCQTVKKNYHEQYTKIDSSNVVLKESSTVSLDNSTINKQKLEEAKANTISIKLVYGVDSGKIQVVHIPSGFQNKEGVNKIVEQLVNERLKEVQIDIKDFSLNTTTNTNVNKDTKDSVGGKENVKIDVSKETKDVVKNVSKKGTPWYTSLFWVGIGIIVLGWVIYKKNWMVQLFVKLKSFFI